MVLKNYLQIINKKFKTTFYKPDWKNLRRTSPISDIFGLDRGKPIDRYYIEKFLSGNKAFIKGTLLEIADSYYCEMYGEGNSKIEILHATKDNPKATIIGDLTDLQSLPEGIIDCFICTQTFNFIFDVPEAIKGSYKLLKKDGVLLATVAGISQISAYDMERWGDFWRFTTLSALKAFGSVFGEDNVEVDYFGNVLSSTALLHGISSEELKTEELDFKDKNYQVTITIRAIK